MAFIRTSAVKKVLSLKKRLRIVQGGTSAGKTIAILLILIDRAQNTPNVLISIVSETYPHLRRGAIKDFLDIMQASGFYQDEAWNKGESTYTFPNNAKVEFFSADQPRKVHGPRRNVLFINEANNIPFDVYTQLEIRTDGDIYIDYNPVIEFWVNTQLLNKKIDCDFLILTYRDNEQLAPTIVASIESRRDNPQWFKVYGEGLLGEIESLIYHNWRILDGVPFEARLKRRGLDFGYTNDPTCIVDIYEYNGGYIIDEVVYQTGMKNRNIGDVLAARNKQTFSITIADSAEPKSIDEIREMGISIEPAEKGPGSVKRGIDYVQTQRISVTKNSVNTIREYRNYVWLTNRLGQVLNEEDPRSDNHAMSAVRYGLTNLKPEEYVDQNFGLYRKSYQ